MQVTPRTKQEIREYGKALERIKGELEAVGETAKQTALSLAAVAFAGATAAVELARSVGQQATEVERQALLLNLTRREYQEWQHVAQQFGADGRSLVDSFLQINDGAQRALDGSKEMTETFASIGISTRQLKGLNPGQLFELIADRVAVATDRQAAMAAVSQLLGEEAARKLGPALMRGSAAIRAMREEAHELGVVMDDEALATAKEAQTQWRRLTAVARGLRNELGVRLAPAITEVLQGVSAWVRGHRELLGQRVREWVFYLVVAVRKLNEAVELIGGWDVIFFNVATGTGILLLIANLGKVQAALSAIRVVAAGLRVVFGVIGLEVTVAMSPLLLLFAGLAFFIGLAVLAVDDFLTFWRGGQSVLGANLDLLERYVPGFRALRDLFGAVAELVFNVVQNFGRLKDAVLNGLAPAFELFEIVLRPIVGLLQLIWTTLDQILSAPLDRITGILRTASGVVDATGASAAVAVQGGIAGRIEGQVSNVNNAVSNATQNWSVQQTNHLYGPASTETTDSIARAIRSASRETGGRR